LPPPPAPPSKPSEGAQAANSKDKIVNIANRENSPLPRRLLLFLFMIISFKIDCLSFYTN
jgi:hypothetical protein